MSAGPRVTVVGSVMADMTVALDRVPDGGETLPGNSFVLGYGGKGANQAVMAALLGARVEVVACVGRDEFGDQALENFRRHGVGTASVRQIEKVSTGVAPIWVDATGENRIVIVPGANRLMSVEQVEAAFASLPAPDVVVSQLEIPLDCVHSALRAGADAGSITILNPAPMVEVSPEMLSLARWLVPNETEFSALAAAVLGDRMTHALEADVAAFAGILGVGVAVTVGSRGVLICDARSGTSPRLIPAPQVSVSDTSGAGDAFVGAFAWALARNAVPESAASFGCACASRSVQRPGTQASFPRGGELHALKEQCALDGVGAPH